jgi:hypothetical protein
MCLENMWLKLFLLLIKNFEAEILVRFLNKFQNKYPKSLVKYVILNRVFLDYICIDITKLIILIMT